MTTFAKRFLLLAISFLAFLPFVSAQESPNRNVRFGMPTPAKSDPDQREDYLIERPQYNAKTKTPNSVSWCLRQEDIGKSLPGAFEPDPLQPKGFTRITNGQRL